MSALELSGAAAAVVAPLNAREARELTDRINEAAGSLWRLLLEAYEREAWRALGYRSWREYATEEFTISQSRAYQILDQGRVITAIADAAGVDISTMVENGGDGISTMVEMSERAVRDIAPDLPEVTATIRTRVEAGEEPAEVVRAVVESKREERKVRALKVVAEPEPIDDGDYTEAEAGADFDLVAELEHAHKEIARLEQLNAALQVDDATREVARWADRYARLEGRLQQQVNTGNEAQRQARYQAGVLRKVREMLGVERDSQITARLAEVLQ